MGDVSKNFNRSEWKCRCGDCEQVGPDPLLVIEMQALRDHFASPVTINSGHRCKTYNRRIGGAPRSKHILGIANDFWVHGHSHDEVQAYLLKKYPLSYGIGRYDTFTHFDVRPYRVRWDNRR